MFATYLRIITLTFLGFLLFIPKGFSQPDSIEKHVLVAMRMIGHEVLLASGDSVSLVLPIKKQGNSYKIEFGSEFPFNPTELVAIVDSVMKRAAIPNRYIAEVIKCDTNEVVYSYEIGKTARDSLIPCGGRTQPKACYILVITLLNENKSSITFTMGPPVAPEPTGVNYFRIAAVLILLLILVFLFLYSRKKKPLRNNNEHIISIGEYLFDKKNMWLTYKNERIDLSHTEADLLYLLYTSENEILEREEILKTVWKDEGEYIGRTLDVFISKLRKKLDADSSVKIVNVRGRGYKLILNEVK